MDKFLMPSDSEIRAQAAKGLHMNTERITLQGLEVISEQIDELNRKLDRVLNLKKQKIKKGVVP